MEHSKENPVTNIGPADAFLKAKNYLKPHVKKKKQYPLCTGRGKSSLKVHHPTKRAVLTDWGLANIKDTVMLSKSHAAGPVGGTYLYMAPVCFISFQEASCYSDIWSLGATYVELFTGSLPWHVKKQRELATLMSANTPPHGLSLLSDSYSFVAELMNYDPLMRPSASKIVQKLKSLVDLKARYGFKW